MDTTELLQQMIEEQQHTNALLRLQIETLTSLVAVSNPDSGYNFAITLEHMTDAYMKRIRDPRRVEPI